jgi:TPR repeat protein
MQKHLIQAAERGDAKAQYNLAVMYENGLLDSRDAGEGTRSEAARWFRAAAQQGLPRAQVKLAEIYAGEPDSSVQACEWYLLAAQGLSGKYLQEVQSAYQRAAVGLTTAQTAEVRRFVEVWAPTGTPAVAVDA